MISYKKFQQTIYEYYKNHRRSLPWRETTDPYRIMISEVMLQQTQVARGLIKYEEFIKRFPDVFSLSRARLLEVLKVWQGLGYNRRALLLKRAAEILVAKYNGVFPSDYNELLALPGVGPSTAAGILNFAFNKPAPYVETNVRSIYIHFFFKNKNRVSDKELLPLIEKTLDVKNPREWHYALLDYGVMLKKTHGNTARRSAHYARQSKFEGSNRQVRSSLLRLILASSPITSQKLIRQSGFPKPRVITALNELVSEGFITETKRGYIIKS